MAYKIPTTLESFNTNLSNLEQKLNQTSPLNDKAFLRVLASMQAGQGTGVYKFAADRILQTLAITATGEGLDIIGANYSVTRKPSEAAAFTIELPAADGTVINTAVDFVGDDNNVRYSVDANSTATGGLNTINVTAKTLGVIGNLNIGNTMTIGRTVAGATSEATITVITNTGAEKESDDNFRRRILDAIRTTPGGGNAADYRIWGEEVAGVQRCYPFAGKPITLAESTAPPDRTVYVQATSAIDPDGIAPQSLLDEVRASLTTNPETGKTRQPLGLTDDTLYVESIVRTTFYVAVNDLTVSASQEAQVITDIETALDLYFKSVEPYVDGLDSLLDKNDVITTPTVTTVVQDIVSSVGGSISSVTFGLEVGTNLPQYQLNPNELAKLGGVNFVG